MNPFATSPDSISIALGKHCACCSPLGVSPFRPGQRPEGQHYLQEATSLGLLEAAMATTPPLVNTAEEAVAIRRLLPAHQFQVLLVTSAFHMRSSQRPFECQGMEVLPFPVDFQERGLWAGPLWRDPAFGTGLE